MVAKDGSPPTSFQWREILQRDHFLGIIWRYVHFQIEEKEDWQEKWVKKETLIPLQNKTQKSSVMPTNTTIVAFSYLRVSGKGQIEGDGFDRQRDAIAGRCGVDGFRIVSEFVEAGVSGTSDLDNRPALSALFLAIMANGVRTVIVERSDRICQCMSLRK